MESDDTNESTATRGLGDRPASITDFDAAYESTPPWDIGYPQPALLALVEAGGLRGRVLDVGCGTGEHALLASSLGFDATGVDSSSRAISMARAKAQERALDASFVVGDALDLRFLDGPVDTVFDSGLFHVFDDEARARYVASLARALSPGGQLFLLCFSDRVPGDFGPRRVSEGELRSSFAEGWHVLSLDLMRMIITLNPGGVDAWRAVISRTD
ncbi:MAG: class I SAM-dependent methyltransferase [Acidimicrobiales bacterium]|jgi:SAM-dependent methyltransferase